MAACPASAGSTSSMLSAVAISVAKPSPSLSLGGTARRLLAPLAGPRGQLAGHDRGDHERSQREPVAGVVDQQRVGRRQEEEVVDGRRRDARDQPPPQPVQRRRPEHHDEVEDARRLDGNAGRDHVDDGGRDEHQAGDQHGRRPATGLQPTKPADRPMGRGRRPARADCRHHTIVSARWPSGSISCESLSRSRMPSSGSGDDRRDLGVRIGAAPRCAGSGPYRLGGGTEAVWTR